MCLEKKLLKVDKSGEKTTIHILNELNGCHHPVEQIKTQNIAYFNENRNMKENSKHTKKVMMSGSLLVR